MIKLDLLEEIPTMASRMEFFFDYGSPFSYLADTQLGGLAARTGAEIVYRPFLLGGVFKETGNASPISIEPKRKYMAVELERWAKRYGVPPLRNAHFPINTMRLMRGAVAAQHLGVFPAYHRAMFDAFWARGMNLGDAAVIREVLEQAGLDAGRIIAMTDEAAVKDELRRNTEDAVRRGAFGAPTFFIGGEMFFGNDRLDFVEQALAAASGA
jgi:2-hydroxychromene-2-carboxylate isomerase